MKVVNGRKVYKTSARTRFMSRNRYWRIQLDKVRYNAISNVDDPGVRGFYKEIVNIKPSQFAQVSKRYQKKRKRKFDVDYSIPMISSGGIKRIKNIRNLLGSSARLFKKIRRKGVLTLTPTNAFFLDYIKNVVGKNVEYGKGWGVSRMVRERQMIGNLFEAIVNPPEYWSKDSGDRVIRDNYLRLEKIEKGLGDRVIRELAEKHGKGYVLDGIL